MKATIVRIALGEFGVTETPGKEHNQTVLNYFHEIGQAWVTTDETAWCSAYANWVALKAGVERSGKLTARSWLGIGTPTDTPQIGDIVILWRESPSSWKGHVGFYIGHSEDGQYIYVLGGNQNNQVNIKAYPVSRVLGYRQLAAIKA